MNLPPLTRPTAPDWANIAVWLSGNDTVVVVDAETYLDDEVVYSRRRLPARQLEHAVDPQGMLQAVCDACIEELKEYKEQAQCAVN